MFAFIGSIISSIVSAVSGAASAIAGAAPAIGAGAAVYGTLSAQEQAKKEAAARAEAERKALELAERQVGEYTELSEAQLKLQAGSTMITTLANLITERESQPTVYTMPAAKTYSPIQQINMAIDKLLRGQ